MLAPGEEEVKEARSEILPPTINEMQAWWTQAIKNAQSRRDLQSVFDEVSNFAHSLCNRLETIITTSQVRLLKPTMDALNMMLLSVIESVNALRDKASELDRALGMPIIKQCNGLLRRVMECAFYGEVLMLRTAQAVDQLRTDFDPEEISSTYTNLLHKTHSQNFQTSNFNMGREQRFDKISEKMRSIIAQELAAFNARMTQMGQGIFTPPAGAREEQKEKIVEPAALYIATNILEDMGVILPVVRPRISEVPVPGVRTGVSGAGMFGQDIWSIDPMIEQDFQVQFGGKYGAYGVLKKKLMLLRWAGIYLQVMQRFHEEYEYEYAYYAIVNNKQIELEIAQLAHDTNSDHPAINALERQFTSLQPALEAIGKVSRPVQEREREKLRVTHRGVTELEQEYQRHIERRERPALQLSTTAQAPTKLTKTTMSINAITSQNMSRLGINASDIDGSRDAWLRVLRYNPAHTTNEQLLEEIQKIANYLTRDGIENTRSSLDSQISELQADFPVGKAIIYRNILNSMKRFYIQALMLGFRKIAELVEAYYSFAQRDWKAAVQVYSLEPFVRQEANAQEATQYLSSMEILISNIEDNPPKSQKDFNKRYGEIANISTHFEEVLTPQRREKANSPWKELLDKHQDLIDQSARLFESQRQRLGIRGAEEAVVSAGQPPMPSRPHHGMAETVFSVGRFRVPQDKETKSMMSALNIFPSDIDGTAEAWFKVLGRIAAGKQGLLAEVERLRKIDIAQWKRSFANVVYEMNDGFPVGKAASYRDGINVLRTAYVEALMLELPDLKQLVEQYYTLLTDAWVKLEVVYGLEKFVKERGVATVDNAIKDLDKMEALISELETRPPHTKQDLNALYGQIANRSTLFEEKLPRRRERANAPWSQLIGRHERLIARFGAVYKAQSGIPGGGGRSVEQEEMQTPESLVQRLREASARTEQLVVRALRVLPDIARNFYAVKNPELGGLLHEEARNKATQGMNVLEEVVPQLEEVMKLQERVQQDKRALELLDTQAQGRIRDRERLKRTYDFYKKESESTRAGMHVGRGPASQAAGEEKEESSNIKQELTELQAQVTRLVMAYKQVSADVIPARILKIDMRLMSELDLEMNIKRQLDSVIQKLRGNVGLGSDVNFEYALALKRRYEGALTETQKAVLGALHAEINRLRSFVEADSPSAEKIEDNLERLNLLFNLAVRVGFGRKALVTEELNYFGLQTDIAGRILIRREKLYLLQDLSWQSHPNYTSD